MPIAYSTARVALSTPGMENVQLIETISIPIIAVGKEIS
jgi:hypothetical protein